MFGLRIRADKSGFNPFFRLLIPMPARLAVFDSDRRYAGDLLQVRRGSRTTPNREDWVTIPYRGSVACVLVVRFDAARASCRSWNGDYPQGVVTFN